MSESRVRVRVRQGGMEAEVEARKEDVREMIDLIPELVSKLGVPLASVQRDVQASTTGVAQDIPEVRIEKGESLPAIIVKLFNNPWGRQPRKLLEVKDVLTNYGLVYPKQSVAVALLRLAKDSKLRRFKQPDGEFVYTASTSLLSPEVRVEPLETLQSEPR